MNPITLMVGLGNPGPDYAQTRHNAGAWLVQAYAKQRDLAFKNQANSQLTDVMDGLRLAMPLTFMNHSGQAVQALCQFYRISLNQVLIVHDDLDLPVGGIKLKTGGGHGGHNGLRDVMQQLGSGDFHRLRVGIGHPGDKQAVLNYVLGKPMQQDRECIDSAIAKGLAIMPVLLEHGVAAAMNELHRTE